MGLSKKLPQITFMVERGVLQKMGEGNEGLTNPFLGTIYIVEEYHIRRRMDMEYIIAIGISSSSR